MKKHTLLILAIILVSACISEKQNITEVSNETIKPLERDCTSKTTTEERDQCFYDKAISEKQPNACSDIEYQNLKYRCRAVIESKPAFCERIDVLKDKDWCNYMMAFKLSNATYCMNTFTLEIKDKCIYNFLKDKKADPFMCFDIVNTTLKDECIIYHISLGRIKPNLCALIEDPKLELECNQTYLLT